MNKYILNSETNIINNLCDKIDLMLDYSNMEELRDKIIRLIRNNRDNSIEDILNNYLDLLNLEMKSILDNNLTKGIEYGIMNDYYSVMAYSGNISNNDKRSIDKDTLFSIDSISKIFTSTLVMRIIRDSSINFNDMVCSFNSDYELDATIESIFKFTAFINTSKRIDYLGVDETIDILKRCIDNKEEKSKYYNYYQYNDIGIMILRQTIPNFLDKLDELLDLIDKDNLTYNNINISNITGGKIGSEYVTPDPKGRGIKFPGHTGMYATILGLLKAFYKLVHTELLLNNFEKDTLWKQPYDDPHIYNLDGSYKTNSSNSYEYMNKVAGIFRVPNNIDYNYDKIAVGNVPNNTAGLAKASSGTCGSWVMGDKLFNNYTTGILTNPYSYIENGTYDKDVNMINDNFSVNKKGVIIGYPKKLRKYKEILVNYAIMLDVITEYIKLDNKDIEKKRVLKKF